MWCAHTLIDSAAMPIVAPTSPLYPKIGLRLNTGMTSEMIPKNGSATMYTSGCPKNQNRCCHSIAPPVAESYTGAPSRRSASTGSRAGGGDGEAQRAKRDVSQEVRALSGGNETSGAPICNGTM